ncbi:tripartite tricarboxylate transporter TctB family protein [Aquibium sp. A9E412]|uniref:tripartite tricarboxylate transporter TctB family protein n=1 Tax=Aquibium sp. A9E412 TaxID=2976767 RepID=UPI0025B24587|nr:tripartite tricarboxylate transporter TctB family protein [Aquibium sp. A9E412]MDN2566333.1 tripartite tricarboxylate transporter TctB family protein [Aquibium sp. A9E412]
MRDTPETGRPDAPGHDMLALAVGAAALALLVAAPWLVDRSGPDPFYKGPLIFPLIALALCAAGALPALWRALRAPGRLSARVDGRGFPRRAAMLFALMALYPPAIGAVGLQAASFAAVLLGLLVVGRPAWQAGLIAAGLAAVLHLAFRSFLDIWFPQPWLLDAIGLG